MMQVQILRWIDYWIGIPLCFLLSIFAAIGRLLKGNDSVKRPVKKILIIKLAELGAVILAYPCFKEIKKIYPDADIYVLAFSKNKPVFSLLEDVVDPGHIATIDDSSWWAMCVGFVSSVRFMARHRFDLVLDLEFYARIGSILSFFSFAPKVIGFYPYGLEGLYRGNFLTHKVFYNTFKHVSVNYFALACALKDPFKNSPELAKAIDEDAFVFPVYNSKEENRKQMEVLGLPKDKKIFLMNPGEGLLPLREWPLENFEIVARHILSDPSNAIALVGSQNANQKANILVARLGNARVVNLSGKTNIQQMMELFLAGTMAIANDCGLMHLAMLTPIHKIVLFGPETPQVFAPKGKNTHVVYSHWPCSPCLSALNHRNSDCRDNHCLKSVKAEKVIGLMAAVLK